MNKRQYASQQARIAIAHGWCNVIIRGVGTLVIVAITITLIHLAYKAYADGHFGTSVAFATVLAGQYLLPKIIPVMLHVPEPSADVHERLPVR